MIQIHSATLQIARQENCLPARPFLPFSPSGRLSASAVRPPRPDASKVNAEDRPITGSPFHSMKYRYPSPASRRWMGRTRSNIRQKQRRPSLPCSYFPFLSTRRRRGRHGQGRQVGHYPRAKTLPSSGTAWQLSYPSPALHSKAWLGHNIITRICDGQSAVSIKLRSIQKKLGQQPCCDSERQESKGDCDRKRRGYSTRTK